jgi:hypothetical protein
MTDMDDDRELSGQLGRLPREAEPEHDLWPGVVARLRGDPSLGFRSRPRPWLPFVQVAAAAVLFAAGLGSGLAIGTARAGGAAGVESVSTAMELAAAVQRTGTEYVAALAAFSAIVDSLSVEARVQGRDAALAALYGAAQEVALLEVASREQIELSVGSEDPAELPTVRF